MVWGVFNGWYLTSASTLTCANNLQISVENEHVLPPDKCNYMFPHVMQKAMERYCCKMDILLKAHTAGYAERGWTDQAAVRLIWVEGCRAPVLLICAPWPWLDTVPPRDTHSSTKDDLVSEQF
jgi:hypothetical protein